MWSHLIMLQSPDRENHLALIITSKDHHQSAISALKASSFPRDYQDWYLLSFVTAYKRDMLTEAEQRRVQIPQPGSLVSEAA